MDSQENLRSSSCHNIIVSFHVETTSLRMKFPRHVGSSSMSWREKFTCYDTWDFSVTRSEVLQTWRDVRSPSCQNSRVSFPVETTSLRMKFSCHVGSSSMSWREKFACYDVWDFSVTRSQFLSSWKGMLNRHDEWNYLRGKSTRFQPRKSWR